MATIGSVKFVMKKAPWLEFTINWTVQSQNGMSSTIKWTASVTDGLNDGYMSYVNLCHIGLYVNNYYQGGFGNGTMYSGSDQYEGELDENNLGSGTFTITRDTATNTASPVIELRATGSGYYSEGGGVNINYTGEGSLGTQTIKVNSITKSGVPAQIVSASDFTDEENPTITYTYDAGSNVASTKIEAMIGFTNSEITIPYREVTGSPFTFELTDEERQSLWPLLQKASYANAKFYLKTTEYLTSGEVSYLEPVSVTRTLSFVNYTPVITPDIYDTNEKTVALTGNKYNLVRYVSDVYYDIGAEPQKGGLEIISSYIKNGDEWIENIPTGHFDRVTSNIFYISATDDRGYTGTKNYSLALFYGEFIQYVKLTCNAKAEPITTDGELDIVLNGKFFNMSFGVQTNKLSVEYAITTDDEEPVWVDLGVVSPLMSSDYNYTYNIPTITGLDYFKSYTVTIRVNDLAMPEPVLFTFVAASVPVFDWDKNDFQFNVPVNVGGELTVQGNRVPAIVEEGTSGIWTYKKWDDGTAECWGSKTITTTINTAWGSMYTTSELSATMVNYPFNFIEAPTVCATLKATRDPCFLIPDGTASVTDTGKYMLVSARNTGTSNAVMIDYIVKGKWR